MQHLALALAIATSHIASRRPADDGEADQDVAVLDAVAAVMRSAGKDEVQALAESAFEQAKEQTDDRMKEQFLNLLLDLGLIDEEA